MGKKMNLKFVNDVDEVNKNKVKNEMNVTYRIEERKDIPCLIENFNGQETIFKYFRVSTNNPAFERICRFADPKTVFEVIHQLHVSEQTPALALKILSWRPVNNKLNNESLKGYKEDFVVYDFKYNYQLWSGYGGELFNMHIVNLNRANEELNLGITWLKDRLSCFKFLVEREKITQQEKDFQK